MRVRQGVTVEGRHWLTFRRYRLLVFWLTSSARCRLFHRLPKRWQESCWLHLERETDA